MTAKTIFRPIWIVILMALAAGSLACATFYEFAGLQPSRPRVQGPAAEVVDTNYYGDEFGYFYAGMVENTGSVDLQYVSVHVDLKDAAGNLVASEYGFTSVTILPAGERLPFAVLFQTPPGPWQTADLHVSFEEATTASSYTQFEILSSQAMETLTGSYQISGELRNTGSRNSDFVMVHAALFDSQNHLLGVAFTYADGTTVPAGSTAGFTVYFYVRGEGAPDHYELYIEGDPVQ